MWIFNLVEGNIQINGQNLKLDIKEPPSISTPSNLTEDTAFIIFVVC